MEKSLFLLVLLPVLFLTGILSNWNSKVKESASLISAYSIKTIENPKCVDCHSDLIESKNVHKPASDSCGTCHAVDIIDHSKNGARGLKLQKNVPALCFGCHKDIEEQFRGLKNVHKAVNVSKSCNNC
ncbi:MAG: cytochrome c3 family protein, partial [Bacteroidales bacterium]